MKVDSPKGEAAKSRAGFLLSALVGVVSALVGLLPWLVTGMRLPMQNLWGGDSVPVKYRVWWRLG